MDVQPIRSTTLWSSMRTVSQKLQESNVCNVGEPVSNRGRSFNFDVYYRPDIERKAVDSSQFRR